MSAVVGVDTIRYTYDRAGNITYATTYSNGILYYWMYNYDALNRLVSVNYYGGIGLTVSSYEYDALGRRIAKRVYSAIGGNGTLGYTRFVYDGANVAFETDSAWPQQRRYTWGGVDKLIAIDDSASGKHYYVATDLLGSVRALARKDSVWALSQRYDPYGALLVRDSDANAPSFDIRYGWTGREFDAESGLYFLRSRYYLPGIGRFIQEDPIGYAGGLNLYSFAGGHPLDSTDPYGTASGDESGESDCPISTTCPTVIGGITVTDDAWTRHVAQMYAAWLMSGHGPGSYSGGSEGNDDGKGGVSETSGHAKNCDAEILGLAEAAAFDAAFVISGGASEVVAGVRAAARGGGEVLAGMGTRLIASSPAALELGGGQALLDAGRASINSGSATLVAGAVSAANAVVLDPSSSVGVVQSVGTGGSLLDTVLGAIPIVSTIYAGYKLVKCEAQ